MPFTNYNQYLTALTNSTGVPWQLSTTFYNVGFRMGYVNRNAAPTPSLASTAVAPDNTSDRAFNRFCTNAGAGRNCILGFDWNNSNTATASNMSFLLVDVLGINGGLSGTVTGTQTTNLPTAALTRYTSGDGVYPALFIQTNIGGTATTVTVQYTNQAGTGSRNTTASVFGGAGFNTSGALVRLGLQSGDTGCRSIESVNIVATTGLVGNFGVMLYKPLAMFLGGNAEYHTNTDCVSTGRMVGQFNEVLDNACLGLFAVAVSGGQTPSGVIYLGEA